MRIKKPIMKRIITLFILALVFTVPVLSQPQFYNGTTGSSSNSFPLNSTSSNHVEWLYGPNLFGSGGTGIGTPAYAGNIVKVYFRIGGTANGTNSYSNFQISMAQNVGTQNSWTNGTFSTTLTTVFFQTSFQLTGAATNTWYGITLQTPFQYDPSLSLIFDMKVTAGTGNTMAQVNNTGLNQRKYGAVTNPTGTAGTGLVDFGFDLVPISTAPNDAGVSAIDSPAGGCEGDYNVVVNVKNFGINQVDTVTVNWMFNGVTQTPTTIYQLLDTFQGIGSMSTKVNLGVVTLTGGSSDTIIAWTTDPNNVTDTVNDNDTAIKVMNPLSLLTTFPHYQDFESGPGEWYTSGSLSSWVLGKPNKTVIKGAASDSNAWVTGGLGTLTHNTSENSQVNSPCFDLSDFKGTPWVAIDVWWNAEFSFDGAVLQSSLDGGKTWQKVGKHLDPNNWYNDNTIVGNPGGQQEGWSGRNSTNNGSTKYLRAKHVLDPSLLIKGVRFRVAFGADASVNDEGFAFDNFILVDMQKPDMGQDTVSLCGNPSLTLDPNIVSNGEFKWFDGDSISTTKVVNAPGIYWVQYTDSMINETKRDTIEVVQSVAPQIAFASTVDTISIDDQITLDPNLPYDLDFTWMPGGYNFPFLLVKASDFGLGSHLFNLHVMDSVLCEDSENVTVVILDYTGIDNRDDGMVEVYPNPVSSTLVLDLRNAGAGSHAVSVSDLQGRILYNNAWELNSGGRIVLDFSGFAPGNYLVRISSAEGVITKQVVKN